MSVTVQRQKVISRPRPETTAVITLDPKGAAALCEVLGCLSIESDEHHELVGQIYDGLHDAGFGGRLFTFASAIVRKGEGLR